MLKELEKLDPMPGRTFAARTNGGKFVSQGHGYVQRVKPGEYVKPEVFAYQDTHGDWLVRVDGRDLPEIHISRKYQAMLADPSVSAEAKSYIRERIRAAEPSRNDRRSLRNYSRIL